MAQRRRRCRLAQAAAATTTRATSFITAPQLMVYPGAAITITVLGFNHVGDGLRDALDHTDSRFIMGVIP